MAPETRSGARMLYAETFNLPPPFKLVTLREAGDAFAHARRIAAPDTAGTLVHAGRRGLAEFALVLEPEAPLRSARRVHYAAMNALADALAAHAPPNKPIDIVWPGTLRMDAGLVGGGRLAWPDGADEDAIPDWLIFGGAVLRPLAAAADDDGLESGRLVEAFARGFMRALDAWYEEGFSAVARAFVSRLAGQKGALRDIADNGDLTTRPIDGGGEPERLPLADALAAPAWLDSATGRLRS